jgi:hypothetical protein
MTAAKIGNRSLTPFSTGNSEEPFTELWAC